MSLTKKRCSRCKKYYLPNEVRSHKQAGWKPEHGDKKWMQHLCRKCGREKQVLWRKGTGKNCEAESSRRAYKKFKHKWVARAKVRYAVQTGKIIKPKKCEVCEKVKLLQGHHENYDEPLNIIWLCSGCHGDTHRLKKILVT